MSEAQQQPTHRESRTVRYAAAGGHARPLLIGVGVVASLLLVIVLAGRTDRAERIPPPGDVTPGRIRVEGIPPAPSPAETAAKPAADGVSEVPVQFYQVLSEGREGASGGRLDVRPLPLPPPPGADAPAATPVPNAPHAAPAPPSAPAVANAPSAPRPAPRAAVPAPSGHPAAPPETAAAPPPPAPKAAPETAGPKPYSLQVGSFSQRDAADDLVNRLNGQGYAAFLAEVDLGAKGVWWRVRVGRYPTEYAAKWARLDLVKEGLSPIVVRDRSGR